MKILKITLLVSDGADELIITTDLPNGEWPYTGNQVVKMRLAAESGLDYIAMNFPDVEYRVFKV